MSWFTTDHIAVLLSVAAALGSLIGWWRNRKAALGAASEAVQARAVAERATSAAERSAASQDSMAQSLRLLAARTDRVETSLDELLPTRSPDWAVTPTTGRHFHVHNIGNATAYEVRLSSPTATTFDPPDPIAAWPVGVAREIFVLGSRLTGVPKLEIEWKQTPVAPDTEHREFPLASNW
ncbi:hypothetical protein [Luteipulveratus mongoliensis]|uniref:Uncharacterized protein n=1 Tax=Luteipulveratus mongoliensis TaxID=571913 RepID=A0A0K1JN94_9MICO|nr:hypothetical protein [Luteipulveratus mongoliensis]AKU18192.1 hypothetical protein VV02_23980 [Luteipulveratus mongoliensis]